MHLSRGTNLPYALEDVAGNPNTQNPKPSVVLNGPKHSRQQIHRCLHLPSPRRAWEDKSRSKQPPSGFSVFRVQGLSLKGLGF